LLWLVETIISDVLHCTDLICENSIKEKLHFGQAQLSYAEGQMDVRFRYQAHCKQAKLQTEID
jgi:hypothetical protein